MRIFVTGGTGLVGRLLIPQLLNRQDEVLCVTRDPTRARAILPDGVELVGADPRLPGVWQDRLLTCDAVINLAGESVAAGRWSKKKKRGLRRSRLAVTENVVDAMAAAGRPMVLVNASAVGYYGHQGSEALSEDHQPGQDFLARLAVEWEHAALQAAKDENRVVVLRIGVVLSRNGGALVRMIPPFKLGLGGPLGSGRQYFPWIHIQDLVRIVLFALDNESMRGPVNAVVPNPPPQREFAVALGRSLGKSAWLPTLAVTLRILLGEKAALVLASQRAVPNALKAHGFRFAFGELEKALDDLFPAGG